MLEQWEKATGTSADKVNFINFDVGGGSASEKYDALFNDGADLDVGAGKQLLGELYVAGVDTNGGKIPGFGVGAELFDVGASGEGLEIGVVDVFV